MYIWFCFCYSLFTEISYNAREIYEYYLGYTPVVDRFKHEVVFKIAFSRFTRE